MRIGLVAAICLSVIGLAAADGAKAAIRKDTSIPAGGLGPALQTLAKEYDFQVLYRTEVVGSLETEGVVGHFTSEEALKQLLKGTGLSYRYLDDKTITIMPASTGSTGGGAAPVPPSTSPPSSSTDAQQERKTGSSSAFLLAQATSGQTTSAASVESTQKLLEPSEVQLQEVLVTAQKRQERLLDVPVPVSAISGEALTNNNLVRIQDYFSSVPGLSATPEFVMGESQVAIRGVTTGGITNPTVSTVIDDVPYGSSSYLFNGFTAPDMDPGDLARLEVLRGPQGTLYGASSMGGLIKFVTLDPSTDGPTGSLQAGALGIANADELGYSFRGSANVPVSDAAAVRVSGFARQEPGYIDDVRTGQKGVNKADSQGGLLSALWRPSEQFYVKLTAMLQHDTSDGASIVDNLPGLGDLQQFRLAGTGWRTSTIGAYNATVKAKVGSADITSITAYNRTVQESSYDFTASPFWSPAVAAVPPGGNSGAPLFTAFTVNRFTQEIRLSAPLGPNFDWLLGAFYSDENSYAYQAIPPANPITGQVVGEFFAFDIPATIKEYAAFTDLTWKVTDQFDIQVGGREGYYKQTVKETFTGLNYDNFAGLPTPFSTPTVNADDNAFTYLVTPRFHFSSDLMLYGRFASGYRIGGPNPSPGIALPTFKPDKTENYEVGMKGAMLENRLTFDASLYYIDWKNLQLQLRDKTTGIVYFSNASRAKSQGIEVSSDYRPLASMRLSAWIALNDAVLTQDIPPDPANPIGHSGDRLPDSSRFSGHISLDQDFALPGAINTTVGASLSYVGDRESVFLVGSANRQVFPGYAETDLHADFRRDSWKVNVFATNVTNKRGILSGGLGSLTPTEFGIIQPRTLGLTVVKNF